MLDSIGGGGWGPIVTSTLLGQGATPRYAIGSVNLAEFFVTVTISATFLFTIGLTLWPIIAGLVIGGVLAAPFAALVTKHLPAKVLMVLVGCVVVVLSMRGVAEGAGVAARIVQTPRYRCCTSGAAASSAEVPVQTTRPRSMR